MSRARLHLGKGSQVVAVNTAAPTITGTRGGALTALPGTWTGATGGVIGQWYADGAATGITTLAFTDSDTTKTLEYREIALPGSIAASAWRGTLVTASLFLDDFEGYADLTRLAQFKLDGTTATATPHDTKGWKGDSSDDTDGTGSCQDVRIVAGAVQKHSSNGFYTVRDFGSPGGTFDLVLPYGAGDQRYAFCFSVTLATGHDIIVYLRNALGTSTLSVHTNARITDDIRANFTFPAFADGDTLRIILDDTAKTIAFKLNGTTVGAASYDLSGWAGPWSNFHGFGTYGADPTVGTNIANSFSYDSLGANAVAAAIAAQPSNIPGKKQVNVTATIGVAGATGAQYKIETAAGALVQGWTNTSTFSAGVGSATFLIPDFAYEGQQLRVLARNVGGASAKIVSQLTGTNGYALQQSMRVGMNDSFYLYAGGQVAGRDIFEQFFQNLPSDIYVVPIAGGSYHDSGIIPPGGVFPAYAHWDEAYNPAQSYPATSTTTDDNYVVCSLNGVMWARTSHTPRSGVAPDPTDSSGTVSGWRRAYYALGTVVGLSADGRPTQLPTDTNLTIAFPLPWNGFKASRYPVTVHCATQPGVTLTLTSAVNITQANINLVAGTFDLVYTGEGQGNLKLSRSTPIDSTFFLSGVPTYETGAPALDVGSPYASVDKIADFAPFYARRNMTAANINRKYGAAHNGMTAANNMAAGAARRSWKYDVDLANQCGHRGIWTNEPDWSDSTIRVARATYHRDHLSANVLEQMVEYMNEAWLNNNWATTDLNTRAATAGVAPHIQYARELKLVMADWESVWTGANAARLKGVAAWQSTLDLTSLTNLLNEGNLYQHIGYFAVAPYFGIDNTGHDVGSYTNTPVAIRNAVSANDQAAFNAAASIVQRSAADGQVTLMRAFYDFLPTYSVSKGLDKNAIKLGSYEANHNIIVNPAAWDAGLGAGMGNRAIAMANAYKRSATYGADEAYFIDQMATFCPHTMMLFDYVQDQAGQQFVWSHMDRMGATTQESYVSAKARALVYN